MRPLEVAEGFPVQSSLTFGEAVTLRIREQPIVSVLCLSHMSSYLIEELYHKIIQQTNSKVGLPLLPKLFPLLYMQNICQRGVPNSERRKD